MSSMETSFRPIEKSAGPPDVQPVDAKEVDGFRKTTYESYERFLRRRLHKLDAKRASVWQRDYASVEAYLESVEPMRDRLKAMLGFWIEPDERPPVIIRDERIILEEEDFVARRFRMELCEGLETYGVELIPFSPGPHPGLLAQHGYAGTPECICGLTAGANGDDYSYRSLGIRAVRRGFHVMAVCHPSGYGSTDEECGALPEFARYDHHYGKNRLHRMATVAGGTLFGLDLLASSRGVDLLVGREGVDGSRLGMYGLSQGGQSALYLPALDPRIHVSVCSAYFNTRLAKLIGPHRALCFLDSTEEDKFFPAVARCFSDSDIVSLVAPRAFAVEAGLKDGSVDFEKSKDEFARAKAHYERLGIVDRIEFISHTEGHVCATARAFEFLMEHLGP